MNTSRSGAAILFLVIMVSAIAAFSVVSVLTSSVNSAQRTQANTREDELSSLLDSCVEEYLWQARANIAYTGGSIVLPELTCTITSPNKVGTTWTTTISATRSTHTKHYQIILQRLTTGVRVTSWKEIAL